MSSISSLGSNAWANAVSPHGARPQGGDRAANFQDKLFARLDKDSSGGIDATELQRLMDKLSTRTGQQVGTGEAESNLTAMDSNGDGQLDKTELSSGLKAALAPLADTLGFAQSRGASGAAAASGPPPEGHPDGGNDGDGDDTSSGAAASSSASTGTTSSDPLDTNGDGTVSAGEAAAGQLKAMVKAMSTLADSNGDQQVSRGEARRFGDLMAQMLGSRHGSDSGGGSSSALADANTATEGRRRGGHDLVNQVLRLYGQPAAAASDAGLSVSA